jgi:hypothetical protein
MSVVLEVRPVPGECIEVCEPVERPMTPGQDGVPEQPRPLTRAVGVADPFPLDSLGSLLGAAAEAIRHRTQAPLAICGQSVLAAATLVVQGHANIQLPTGQNRPLANFFLTVAGAWSRSGH